jgi:hypothetical protein
VPLGFFATIAVLVYIIAQHRTRREALRAELHAKLLERVGSAREFGDFLGSPAGERFLESLAPTRPLNRLFWSIGVGTFAVAFALILLAANFLNWTDLGGDGQAFAFFVLAFGLAVLVSAAISHAAARRFQIDLPPEHTLPSKR